MTTGRYSDLSFGSDKEKMPRRHSKKCPSRRPVLPIPKISRTLLVIGKEKSPSASKSISIITVLEMNPLMFTLWHTPRWNKSMKPGNSFLEPNSMSLPLNTPVIVRSGMDGSTLKPGATAPTRLSREAEMSPPDLLLLLKHHSVRSRIPRRRLPACPRLEENLPAKKCGCWIHLPPLIPSTHLQHGVLILEPWSFKWSTRRSRLPLKQTTIGPCTRHKYGGASHSRTCQSFTGQTLQIWQPFLLKTLN